jgi:hypothetical protein
LWLICLGDGVLRLTLVVSNLSVDTMSDDDRLLFIGAFSNQLAEELCVCRHSFINTTLVADNSTFWATLLHSSDNGNAFRALYSPFSLSSL